MFNWKKLVNTLGGTKVLPGKGFFVQGEDGAWVGCAEWAARVPGFVTDEVRVYFEYLVAQGKLEWREMVSFGALEKKTAEVITEEWSWVDYSRVLISTDEGLLRVLMTKYGPCYVKEDLRKAFDIGLYGEWRWDGSVYRPLYCFDGEKVVAMVMGVKLEDHVLEHVKSLFREG